MRIAVLGAAGATGKAAVKNLAENKDVSEILAGDFNEQKLEKLSAQIKSKKLVTRKIDVREIDETSAFLKGCDVVVNAVQYYHNLDVMKAALKSGVHYVDHGGLYHVTLKQLELDPLFKSKGLTAVVGMGAQPGLTNLAARHAYDILDEMKAVYIRDGYRDLTPNGPLFTWSPQTLFDEMTMDAVILRDGKLVKVKAFSISEVVEFPDPVGKLETYVTLHSELATFPKSFCDKGLTECDWMEGSPELSFVRKLAEIGLGSSEEVEYHGCRISPRNFLIHLLESKGLIGFHEEAVPNDWEFTILTVYGNKIANPVKLTYLIVLPPKADWRMSCAQTGVGIPSSTAAVMIASGEIMQRGVLPPESCIEPEPFFQKISTYGFEVKTTEECL